MERRHSDFSQYFYNEPPKNYRTWVREKKKLPNGETGHLLVNYPMGKPRGLQLARNDKAAVSGRLTAARQNRNPAACASSDASVGYFTPAPFPAGNPPNIPLWKVRCANRLLRQSGAPKHTGSIAQRKETALPPCLKAGASAPEKGEPNTKAEPKGSRE